MKKTISVTKKSVEAEALRWREFVKACSVPYENLSDEWYEFFVKMGYTDSKIGELSKLADKAIEAQADVDSSTGENLVRLVDKAIEADLEKLN